MKMVSVELVITMITALREAQMLKCGDMKYHEGYDQALIDVTTAIDKIEKEDAVVR